MKSKHGRISKEPETVKSPEEEFRVALGLNGVWDRLRADTKRWEAFRRAWNATPLESEPERGLFVDLVALWQGGIKPERPTLARVSKTRCLFYRGRINEIHGEPSVGKTNIAVYAVMLVLAEGGSVIYLDPEDNEIGFLNRLLGLGLATEPLLIEEISSEFTIFRIPLQRRSIKQKHSREMPSVTWLSMMEWLKEWPLKIWMKTKPRTLSDS
jgi:hypothetical protein